jgi:hypothetical protein
MIGIMIQIIQSDLKDSYLDNSFYQNSVDLWLAPPQGLLLDRVTFDAYNKKRDIPEPIVFTEEEVNFGDTLLIIRKKSLMISNLRSFIQLFSKLKRRIKGKNSFTFMIFSFTSWLAKIKENPKMEEEESSGGEMEDEDAPKQKKGGKGGNKDSDDDEK